MPSDIYIVSVGLFFILRYTGAGQSFVVLILWVFLENWTCSTSYENFTTVVFSRRKDKYTV